MNTTLLNNRYQILQSLGRGGFGETYLATDTHMPSGRKCVIKQLKPVIQQPDIPQWMQERFQREAAILEELGEGSSQIPRLYAYFSENGNFYLVQEWIEGVTLTQRVQQRGILSEKQVTDILLSLLPVLDYVHSRRIVHRDIKPDNIILRSADNRPVLIDFGIVKETMATVVSEGHSAFSLAIGTPGYMSSEQAAGRPVYSSDLYSLGLIAVYLLTGENPQTLETDAVTGEINWRKVAPNLHSHLAMVIDGVVRFHPRDRFSSAKEMLKALQPQSIPSNAPTIAFARGNFPSPNPSKPPITRQALTTKQPVTPGSKRVITPQIEQDDNNNWLKYFIPTLLIGVMGIGGFAIGFSLISNWVNNKGQSLPSPSPSEPVEPTEQPTPELLKPTNPPRHNTSPTPSYQPPETQPTPSPKSSPESSPPIEPLPSPEPTLGPTLEPYPETSPTPGPKSSLKNPPTPSLESSPKNPRTPGPESSSELIPRTPSPESSSELFPQTSSPESSPKTPLNPNPDSSSEIFPRTPSPESSLKIPPTPNPELTPATPPSSPSPTPSENTRGNLSLPTFRVGSKNAQVLQTLGNPTSKKNGYWRNSEAWLYQNYGGKEIDLGYLFQRKNGKLRQVEASFPQVVKIRFMQNTLNKFLGGSTPSDVQIALRQIYNRQSNNYSFQVGNLKGQIERNTQGKIYIGVWEADFH
jgi:serine/threonine-protein kinase